MLQDKRVWLGLLAAVLCAVLGYYGVYCPLCGKGGEGGGQCCPCPADKCPKDGKCPCPCPCPPPPMDPEP